MTSEKSGYVNVDGGRLYYEAAGQGRPVVLAHAGFVDRRSWDDQWEPFAEHFRVVRFDLRGFGKSDAPTGPVSRRDDLYRLVQHLGLGQAAFVAASMSGESALDLALEHPELVSALVLVSTVPSGFTMQGEPPAVLLEMMAAMQRGDIEQASELQTRLWIDGPFRQPAQVDPNVRLKAGEMNQTALKHGTWGIADALPLNPLDPPAVGRLGEVKARTLVIAGALDNSEIGRAADVLAAGIPDAKKVIVEDAAHLPNMEKPQEFNTTVLNFLGAAA
jgi:pimeloyl-ACP methyl ester carboxylesterase